MQIFNFSAGPAVLPKTVLQQVRDEMLDWHGSGMSVMEMSHRGKEFMQIAAEAEADLRALMQIPSGYKVLFLQGGAHSQFSMVPQNLLKDKTQADYLDTGIWSQKAISEASRYCDVNVVASSHDKNYTYVPDESTWKLNSKAAYLHITSNETIGGLEMFDTPKVSVPLVCDMSSHILSRPIKVDEYGLIYAGAQKNIGPAGLTIVIVHEDLIGQTLPGTPTMFDYQTHAEHGSMYNTPPTFAIYVAGLVFKWLIAMGGLSQMEKTNLKKSQLLYEYIDQSALYQSPIDPKNRSRMNIPFTLNRDGLDERFLKEAQANGLLQLKGHKLVGGMRASIYNAMPIEGVEALVSFMQAFEKANG
jgi:phosphoserine aminotransferase